VKSLLRGQPPLACCIALLALLLSPDALALQSLCQNSPETPAVVLGLIGGSTPNFVAAGDFNGDGPWTQQGRTQTVAPSPFCPVTTSCSGPEAG